MQRLLITFGIIMLLLGVFYPIFLKLNLGKLPGDIYIKKGNFSFFFPITTSIILSISVSGILYIFNKYFH